MKNEVSLETEKMINEAVNKIAESTLQKEFLQLAVEENSQSFWCKTISDIFRKFKEWWFKSRRLEVVEKTKTSIYERLKEAQRLQMSIMHSVRLSLRKRNMDWRDRKCQKTK